MNADSTRLGIPHSGDTIAATVGYAIGLLLFMVAAGNLVYATRISITAIVASVLWIGLMVVVITWNIWEAGGVRHYLINCLGNYSHRHFVRANPPTGKAETVLIGYSLLGRDWICLEVDSKAISTIEWCAGQGSALSGRDLNDWNVVLWYHPPRGKKIRYPSIRQEELFIVGPFGPRSTVEEFGKQLVEFLIGAGVKLQPGRNNCEFNTPARRKTIEQEVGPPL